MFFHIKRFVYIIAQFIMSCNLDWVKRSCGQQEKEYTAVFALLSCTRTRMDGETFSSSRKIPRRKIHKTDVSPDKETTVCAGLLPVPEHKKISRGRSRPRMDRSQWRDGTITAFHTLWSPSGFSSETGTSPFATERLKSFHHLKLSLIFIVNISLYRNKNG